MNRNHPYFNLVIKGRDEKVSYITIVIDSLSTLLLEYPDSHDLRVEPEILQSIMVNLDVYKRLVINYMQVSDIHKPSDYYTIEPLSNNMSERLNLIDGVNAYHNFIVDLLGYLMDITESDKLFNGLIFGMLLNFQSIDGLLPSYTNEKESKMRQSQNTKPVKVNTTDRPKPQVNTTDRPQPQHQPQHLVK